MVLFESLGAASYSPSIVTIALSCISFEIKRDIGRKSWFFHTPCIHPPSVSRVPVEIFASCVVWKKYNGGATRRWKNFENMYNRLDTIPAINRQTDRQTEGRTDILPRPSPRYAYASRGKTENHTALKLRGEVTHIRSSLFGRAILRSKGKRSRSLWWNKYKGRISCRSLGPHWLV